MLTNVFLKAISNVWPMLFIFTVIIVTIRLAYLIYNKKKIVIYKEIFTLCFIIYLLLLYYIVTFQDNNYGTNNFVPLREIFRYKVTSKLFIKNIVGNILLFVPLGIFITYYVKNKSCVIVFLISLIISCSIEFVQSMIGRTVDVDDVILNTTGGVLGYYLCSKANNIANKLPKFMKSQVFLDVLSLVLIVAIVYVLFKLKFWRFIR